MSVFSITILTAHGKKKPQQRNVASNVHGLTCIITVAVVTYVCDAVLSAKGS